MSPTDLQTWIPGLPADGVPSASLMEFRYPCDGACRDRSPKSPVLLWHGPVLARCSEPNGSSALVAEDRACILSLTSERRGWFPGGSTVAPLRHRDGQRLVLWGYPRWHPRERALTGV